MSIRVLASIDDIAATEWDALWPHYPFTKHAFLRALETSACTTRENGWQVCHLIYEQQQRVCAALPLYLKFDSWGEYVFDWSWADAYQRHGLDYYPKLLNGIPFTPATGPRLGFDAALTVDARAQIAAEFVRWCSESEFAQQTSGLHILFPDKQLSTLLPRNLLLERWGCQFHWFNQHYRDFDDFLAHFNSRKRKNVHRERARVAEAGLDIVVETGSEIPVQRWQTFFDFYHRTYLKRSGRFGYLNEAFFQQLGAALGEQVVLVSALKNQHPLAMALYFRDHETLYGRYWGCAQEVDCLHFELCYYQGIDYAIQHQLQRFDPGAQGEHKIQRGFTPVYTRSFHHLKHPPFHAAIARFVAAEKQQLALYMEEARKALPFRDTVQCVDERVLLAPAI